MKPSKELRIYAMGRKRFLQLMKCQVKDSGIYTCDAGDAASSCNVDVYGKKKQKKKKPAAFSNSVFGSTVIVLCFCLNHNKET